jgi:hypothetical protein
MNGREVRLVHTSDWHLGAPIGWGPDKQTAQDWISMVRRDREAAIDEVIRVACANSVDAVLVAGDILDQPELPVGIRGRCEEFLRERVVAPLASHGIRLCLTPGTHDWFPKRKDRNSSLALLRTLASNLPENIQLLEPAGVPGNRVATVEIKGLRIATEPPSKSWQGRWIEFLHDCDASRGGQPIYRAYGDRHILTVESKHGAHYPGSPFVRSSASDNGHTDVGPRHVLVVTITPSSDARDVRRQPLGVKEVAVLKGGRKRHEWTLFYERDYEKGSWKTTKPLEANVAVVVDHVRRSYPAVGYVTLIVPDEDRALQRHAMMLGRSIVGSRPGIISISLDR